jgi:hypothetical protein
MDIVLKTATKTTTAPPNKFNSVTRDNGVLGLQGVVSVFFVPSLEIAAIETSRCVLDGVRTAEGKADDRA